MLAYESTKYTPTYCLDRILLCAFDMDRMLGNLVDAGHVGASVPVWFLRSLQIRNLKIDRMAECQLSLPQSIFLMSIVDAGEMPVLSETAESELSLWGGVGWPGSTRAQTGGWPSLHLSRLGRHQ